MQRLIKILFSAMLIGSPLVSAGQQSSADHNATVIAFAAQAGSRALNFRQGDADGFARSRNDFTEEGWKAFMKDMQAFLDDKGAPTFTSSFASSGEAKVLSEENGVVRLRIPGTLSQSNNLGKTTYRVALEVIAGGDPVRIHKLEPIMCAASSKNCQ